MAAIQCKVEIPSVEGLNDNQLTVGREFLLVCEGEFPKNLAQEKLQFVLLPEHKYVLHLLNFEFRSPTQADLKVTSYLAAKYQNPDLQITDGTQTVSLGPVALNVESVLPKSAPGQPAAKQEPYGPIGPASLSVPALYWAILAGAIGLIILIFISKIYRVVQRRNMLARLKEHDSALTPLAQFHQNLRRLQRVNTVFFGGAAEKEHVKIAVEETYGMLKLYLTRQYQIPAMEWSTRLIMRDLKKYHPKLFAEYGLELKKLLKEYYRAVQDKETLKETDALNLVTHCRQLVEKMERLS